MTAAAAATPTRPVHILLVEDNKADVVLLRRTLNRYYGANVQITHCWDGEEAMDYLTDIDSEPPDVIFLDLKMPQKDGREVLGELRVHERLHSIPVVVLTSSEAETDIAKSYQLGASAYAVKPVEPEEYDRVARSLGDHWVATVRYP